MPRFCYQCLHLPASPPLLSPSLHISADSVSIRPRLYFWFNFQSKSLLPYSSAVIIAICLRLRHLCHRMSLLLMFLLCHLSDAFVPSVPHIYHLIFRCTNSLTTHLLSHIFSTTIIILSHQPAFLSPTSLSHISSVDISILHHLTTFSPRTQSSRISAAADAAILLNHHPVPPPPLSYLSISTTVVIIFMRLHCPLHYPTTLIDIICHFLVGQILSRNPRLATTTLATSTTETVAFTFSRSLIYVLCNTHPY